MGKKPEKQKKLPPPPLSLLKISFLSGLSLLALFGLLLAGIYSTGGISKGGESESRFYRLLQEYDYKYRQAVEAGLHPIRLQELDAALDRLEKQAKTAESWLSILKRRRQLFVHADSRAGPDSRYRQSAERAALAFPNSEPIAAVAAAAAVYEAAITREGDAELRKIIPLLEDSRYAAMRLSLHVLLGDFNNPQAAAEIFSGGNDFLAALINSPDMPPAETGPILTDYVILNILAGNRHGADSALNIAFSVFPSPGLINLAAEYYYDFGDPQRSAELFSMLDGDAALGRQADALWLAGYRDSAREKWRMILFPHGVLEPDGSVVQPAMQDTALHSRALYNLAITEESPDEAEKLFTVLLQGIPPDLSGNGLPSGTANYSAGSEFIRQIGFIRYSRLKEAPKALEILETGKKQGGEGQPLIDLEIIKRRAEIEGPGRVIAETWILLGRYPAEENLYQWGAWYFDFQRNFTESGLLLKAAARQGFSGNRLGIHEGLRLIREGMLDAAEEKLAALPENSDTWAVLANRGRIFEASRAPARAIDCYAKAVEALLQNENYSEAGAKKASNIQVNIARCLKTTGKTDECRQALEKALELNAENLKARLELERL